MTKDTTTFNTALFALNSQAPILTCMCTQIPILSTLSIKSAEVAQNIKLAWDDINFKLGALLNKLDINEATTDRTLRKLPTSYYNSKRLGIPVSQEAQQAFKIKNRMGSRYYYSEPQRELIYIPEKKLQEIITKIRAEY